MTGHDQPKRPVTMLRNTHLDNHEGFARQDDHIGVRETGQ
jgi:hypothetical protein